MSDPVPLRLLTLGRALGDLERVREDEGPNLSREIRGYFANLDPPVLISESATEGYPWCAAAVQYWSDEAARLHGLENPLDLVNREAWVPDYAEAARRAGWVVTPEEADEGCLAIFSFGGKRFDHIAILARPPVVFSDDGALRIRTDTVDGNSNTAGSRDGDRVVRKTRTVRAAAVLFAKWDNGITWEKGGNDL